MIKKEQAAYISLKVQQIWDVLWSVANESEVETQSFTSIHFQGMKAGEKGVHYLTKLHSTKMARSSVIPLS